MVRAPDRPQGRHDQACSVASTRSATCRWPAGRSSASSTRSTCRSWRSAGTGRPHGTGGAAGGQAVTPTRRRSRSSRARRRRRPGSTTWASSRAEHEEAARRDRIRYDALAAGEDDEEQEHGGRRAGDRRPGRGRSATVIAWAARLSAGPGSAGAAETAAYLAAKADRAGAHRRRARGRRLEPRRRRSRPRGRRRGPRGRGRGRAAPPRPASPPWRTDMIDLRNHYGFTRTPFGKDLAPSMLHRYPAHAEAVARITWCARERGARGDHGRSRLREDSRRARRRHRARPDSPHPDLPARPDDGHERASTTTW